MKNKKILIASLMLLLTFSSFAETAIVAHRGASKQAPENTLGDNYTEATLELHDTDLNWSFVDGHVSTYNTLDPDTYGTGTLASPAGFWTVTRGD